MCTIVTGSRATPVNVYFIQKFDVPTLLGNPQGQNMCDILIFNLIAKVHAMYTSKQLFDSWLNKVHI